MNALIPRPALPAIAGLVFGFLLVLLSSPLGLLLATDSSDVLTLGIRIAVYGPLLSLLWLIAGGMLALLVSALD